MTSPLLRRQTSMNVPASSSKRRRENQNIIKSKDARFVFSWAMAMTIVSGLLPGDLRVCL